MRRRHKVAVGAALAAGGLLATTAAGAWYDNGDRSRAVRRAIQGGRAKNVIMFLGDGMGDSEITVARNYAVGAAGRLSMDTLPLTGEYTTYAVKQGTWETPDYVTDSAASGTGWATGHKTYNNAISVDPVTKAPLYTILELAQRAGYKTGNVTTAELTDATPAVLDSHVSLRACQGPADMATCPTETKEAGGLGSIAEQTVEHHVDVLMGGGKQRFDQTITGGPFVARAWCSRPRPTATRSPPTRPGSTPPTPTAGSWASSRPATWTSSGPARWPRRIRGPPPQRARPRTAPAPRTSRTCRR
jgi:alkaline phosphatase